MDSGGLKLSGRVLGSLKTQKSRWSSIGPFVPPLFWDTNHKKALEIYFSWRKVEATKFTKVGYHGRDMDQIINNILEEDLDNEDNFDQLFW